MNVIEKMRSIGQSMKSQQASMKDTIMMNVSDRELVDGVDRLIYNHALNKTELVRQFKMSRPTLLNKIDEAINSGVIPEPFKQNKMHLFSRHHVKALMDSWGMPVFRDIYNQSVISFENHKGGTGKTSSSITLAVATALDIDLNANVLFIDLDPQGSAGPNMIYSHEEDSIYLTAVDLILSEFEEDSEVAQLLEDGMQLDDIILNSPFESHLPSLHVLPAFPTDDRFTDIYWTLNQEERKKLLLRLANKIIPILKTKYDLIFIDLPPQDSPLLWSANEATDMLIVPLTPQEFDFASTANYLLTTADRFERSPSQGKNIKLFKMLVTNYNDKSSHQKKTVDKLLRSATVDMFTSMIAHSEAFVAASESNRTVLDVMKSEKICSDGQYDIAINSVKATYQQFINEVKSKSIQ